MQAEDFVHILPKIQDIRRNGSAALDLCMVADGSINGYFEVGAKPWDYSAGVLIAQEAGALASGLFGKPASPDYVVCAAPLLQREMVTLLESLEEKKS
jgi:myo-inositol-1(or 4)-monophosphatase